MLTSLKILFSSEYNKTHKWFALKRFLCWKVIKALKLKNVKYRLWGDKKILLNYDSFQSMWIMYNYIVDWEEFHLIKHLLRANSQACDIGSNMGFYTVWMSKFIESGMIHAFEPDQHNFERLTENVKLNLSEDMVALNKMAVSDTDGTLHFTRDLDGENHIDPDIKSSYVVPSKRLDTYAFENSISHFDYVKIDVEGFEYFALKGAETLLGAGRISVLQLEINSTVSNSGTTVDDLLGILDCHDYKLCGYNVERRTLVPIAYSPARENYFAVHDFDRVNSLIKNSIEN